MAEQHPHVILDEPAPKRPRCTEIIDLTQEDDSEPEIIDLTQDTTEEDEDDQEGEQEVDYNDIYNDGIKKRWLEEIKLVTSDFPRTFWPNLLIYNLPFQTRRGRKVRPDDYRRYIICNTYNKDHMIKDGKKIKDFLNTLQLPIGNYQNIKDNVKDHNKIWSEIITYGRIKEFIKDEDLEEMIPYLKNLVCLGFIDYMKSLRNE